MAATYMPGRFWGKVTAQALGESKQKKTPQFALQFSIMGRIDPANPEGELLPSDQSERTVYLYITDKTIDFVTRDLERLGFHGDSFSDLDPRSPGFHDFTGAETGLLCEHETYEGKVHEKWSLARSAVGLDCEPMDAKRVRELDSLFGKNLKGIKKPTVKPTEKKPEPVVAGSRPDHHEDDIPFALLIAFCTLASVIA